MNFDIIANLQWIWEHVWGTLKQMGGVVILTGIIAFIVQKINVHYEKRIEHKYDKIIEELKVELDNQREHYKSLLERRNYVSRARFDAEFTICKELMIACKTMIDSIYFLFPNKLTEELFHSEKKWTDKNTEYWVNAIEATKKFGEILEGNAPFISKEIHGKFKDIYEQCRLNITVYMYRCETDPLNIGTTQEECKRRNRGRIQQNMGNK